MQPKVSAACISLASWSKDLTLRSGRQEDIHFLSKKKEEFQEDLGGFHVLQLLIFLQFCFFMFFPLVALTRFNDWKESNQSIPDIQCSSNSKRHGSRDPPFQCREYPLVNVYITIENHHFQWVNPLKMVIFNSYVTNYQRVIFRAFSRIMCHCCSSRSPKCPMVSSLAGWFPQ